METAITNPNEALAIKPRRRWHWTTCLIGSLVLLAGVVMNLGGDLNPRKFALEYGWPWVYGIDQREIWEIYDDSKGAWWRCFRVDSIVDFKLETLTWNSLTGLALTLLVAMLWDVRLRKRMKLIGAWRFTITDWFYFCACFALVYTAWVSWTKTYFHDRTIERELRQTFYDQRILAQKKAGWQYFDSLGDLANDSNKDFDVPSDWLWLALRIPHSERPYQRLRLRLDLSALDKPGTELPVASLRKFKKLQHLQELELSLNYVELPDAAGPLIAFVPQLTKLEVHHATTWNDESLGAAKALRHLVIDRAPLFQGHRIAEQPHIETLELRDTALDDEGLRNIAGLRRLKSLAIEGTVNFTAAGWRALESLERLVELKIDATHLSDETLGSLRDIDLPARFHLRVKRMTAETIAALKRVAPVNRLMLSDEIEAIDGCHIEGQGEDMRIGYQNEIVDLPCILQYWKLDEFRTHVYRLQINGSIDDQTLQSSDQLKHLGVSASPNFRGHRLTDFPNIENLYLFGTSLDDEGLEQLAKLNHLRCVQLQDVNNVSAKSWSRLAELTELDQLDIIAPNLDDTALAAIATLPNLSSLTLDCSAISLDTLALLKTTPKLKYITFYFTNGQPYDWNKSNRYHLPTNDGPPLSRQTLDELIARLKAIKAASPKNQLPSTIEEANATAPQQP